MQSHTDSEAKGRSEGVSQIRPRTPSDHHARLGVNVSGISAPSRPLLQIADICCGFRFSLFDARLPAGRAFNFEDHVPR